MKLIKFITHSLQCLIIAIALAIPYLISQSTSYGTPMADSPGISVSSSSGQGGNQEPVVIHIHEVIRAINNEYDCNPSQWKDREDACQCCLLYAAGTADTESADTMVNNCISSQHCSKEHIKALKKELQLPESASQKQLLEKLTQRGLAVKKMKLDDSFFGASGTFTENSLPRFLARAFEEKKITNADFSKEACLKAKNLGTQGGYNTLQLFLVTSTCQPKEASMYIIKEARHGLDEAVKLATVGAFEQFKDIIAPKVKAGMPTLALPLAYFSYPKNNTIHYIAAMPAAKGKDLATLIHKFRQDQTKQNRELLNRAFMILGKETANFHKRFMVPEQGKQLGKTIVHGDFHVFNLFFDEIGGHFTWIDNETIALTLKSRTSPSVDIVKLFFMPFSTNTDFQQFRDLIAGIGLETWFDIALKNFVTGYKDAFEKNNQKKVLQELKKIFNDPFTIQWVDFDKTQLKELREKYINPIFDTLSK